MKKSFFVVFLLALVLFTGSMTLISTLPLQNWQHLSQQWESTNTIHITYVTPTNDIGSVGEVVIAPIGSIIVPVFILYPNEFRG